MDANGSRTPEEVDSELLTAYLDGELSESETIAVEKRLATDSEFRTQMQDMQNAWDMLDALPVIKPDSAFVRTTVEMAIAGKHGRGSKGWMPMLLAAIAMLGIPLALFAVAFFSTRESIEQPERELVEELGVIENFDRYDKVISDNDPGQGISFLKSIYERGVFLEVDGLFPVESGEEMVSDLVATTKPPSATMSQDRIDRLAGMTDQQRDDLFVKKQKFESLPRENQAAIRSFHDMLSQDPQRERLVQALVSYYDWLKTLRTSQRNNVLDSPMEQRLEKIRMITMQQSEYAFGRSGATKLPVEDAEAFYRWYHLAIAFYNRGIRQQAGDVFTRIREDKGLPVLEEDIERVVSGPMEQLVDFLMRHDREYFGELITANRRFGLADLENQLTGSSLQILNDVASIEGKQELVLRWVEVANKTRFPIQTVNLKSFYEKLPQVTRDAMANQHPDDWYESLTSLYWEEENIRRTSEPAEEEEFRQFLRENGLDGEFGIEETGEFLFR